MPGRGKGLETGCWLSSGCSSCNTSSRRHHHRGGGGGGAAPLLLLSRVRLFIAALAGAAPSEVPVLEEP